MQLKTIAFKGQCRGRPPTRGDTRDGPCPVVSWQYVLRVKPEGSSVISIYHDWTADRRPLTGNLEPFAAKRRWGDTETVGSRQHVLRVMPEGSAAGSQDSIVVKRRRYKYGVMIRELIHINSRLRTQDSRLSLARDWVTITCSVNWLIRRDRDKDRLKTLLKLPKVAERERYALSGGVKNEK